ncbi:transporter substrate-binding domain-containing protein [Silvimonas soli]|uniref:transporter substrate-binding domain-containing protein n=1 Tax=Silvimonas soli TaxID=2980100 RepID=UPI0024B3C4EE|nr:transporter substrate-binding domain-containing protein [Silvimonas soli]
MRLQSIFSRLVYPIVVGFLSFQSVAVLADTLDTIKSTGEVKVGYRESSQPVSYAVNDVPTGFVIDLCRDIVANSISPAIHKQVKIKFVPVTAQNRLGMLTDGKIDMECGSTTITEDRLKKVDFSVVDFVTSSRLVALSGAPVTLQALSGKTVALKSGSSHVELLSKMIGNVHVLYVNDAAQGVQAVVSKQAAAYLDDEILIQSAIHKAGLDRKNFGFSDPLSVEPYGIALRRGDTAFNVLVNAGIRSNFSHPEKAIASLDSYSSQMGSSVNNLTRDAIRWPAHSRQCSLIDKGDC